MAIQTTCPECEHEYRLRNHYAGATVRCRQCRKTFQVEGGDAAATPLKRTAPGLAMALLVGTFVGILMLCIGMPVGALWLFGKKPVKTQQQAGPAKQVRSDDTKQAAAPKPDAQDRPKESKPAEKQAADYLKDLDNADPKVREAAFKALAKLKDESTIPSIARHLTDNKDRRSASEALKAFGAAAETEVVKYLQEKDKAVRIETCRILSKVGTKASIPALEQTTKAKEKDVAKEAQTALKEIEKRG